MKYCSPVDHKGHVVDVFTVARKPTMPLLCLEYNAQKNSMSNSWILSQAPSVLHLAWLVSEDESKENIIFVIYTLGVIHSFNSFICSAGLCQVLCYFEKPAVPAGGRAEEIAINSYDFPRKLSTAATNSFTACSASPPDHPNVTVTTSKVSLHVF